MDKRGPKRAAGSRTSKGYWRVRVSVEDEYGRSTQKGFERKTLAAAQAAARDWLAENGRLIRVTPTAGTLAELFEYVEKAIWNRDSADHQRSMRLYRGKWEGVLGDVVVTDLSAPILTRALTGFKLTSKSAIGKCTLCIRQAVGYAVSDLGWLDARECHLFTARDRWILRVPKSKTEAGNRMVPIPDTLVPLLQARRDEDWTGIEDPSDHVRKWWRANSKTRLYDFRGWYSDNLRRRGVPGQVRTVVMGHTKEQFTQQVYETILETDLLDAFFPQDAIGGKIGGKVSSAGEKEPT